MLLRPENLPRDPDLLIAMVLEQAAEIETLRAALKTINNLAFGARSERGVALVDAGQLALDLGDLATDVTPTAANDDAAEAAAGTDASKRPRSRRNIGFLPRHLARIEEVIEPETSCCPCCAGALHRIGQDVSEALDVVPAILRVIRTIRPKYACRACSTKIVQEPARPRLLDGGMATTSMIAHIVVNKFAWHLPLSRQTQMLAGQGVQLDRSILCKWVKRTAWWLSGLYERQIAFIHAQQRVFCDETRMPVRRAGQRRTHTGQFWAHAIDDRGWCGPAPPAVAYIFASGRGKHEISQQLADYQGLLQVDGYGAYKGLAKPGRKPGAITLAFCLAHARRKFTEVLKTGASPFARQVVAQLAAVYAIEAEIRGTSAAHRLFERQARSAPLMARLKLELEDALTRVSTQSGLARAIGYTLDHWAGLILFLDDGRLEVDNNSVERSMRPIALGRRNSLFAGNDGGAKSWAILASLLNTARLNGLDPFTYINDVLERIVSGAVKNHELDQLLAWNWKAARDSEPAGVAA